MDTTSAWKLTAMAVPLAGAAGVMAWRLRETRRPVTHRSIVFTPVMMSTWLSMFLMPALRVPWLWGGGAFAAGALVFAYPLMRSTRLQRHEQSVKLQRSRAFLVILMGLAVMRLVLRDYVDDLVSPQQTAALFYLLALGMILRWRTAMALQFRALHR